MKGNIFPICRIFINKKPYMIVSEHFIGIRPNIIIPKQSHISPRILKILLCETKLAWNWSKHKWTFQILFFINPFCSLRKVCYD